MEFEQSSIGKLALSRHESLIQYQRQQEAEERERRQREHEAKLQAEPYELASELLRAIFLWNPEHYRTGSVKEYAPLRDSRSDDGLAVKSRLGLSGQISFWKRIVRSDIELSLEITTETPDGNQESTEQVIAKLSKDSERPYGFAKSHDAQGMSFGDPSPAEAQELRSIVREAAEVQRIPVLPLELPPQE